VDGDTEISFTGFWNGSIAKAAAGEFGHGYDPIFVPEGFEITAAQLEPEIKNALSHRAEALAGLIAFLRA
jgi:XTP/dITP diphosphohydrolase